MKLFSRRSLLSAALGLGGGGLLMAASGHSTSTTPAGKRQLGEELLRAAEGRDWKRAQSVLEQGADPNTTSFTRTKPFQFDERRERLALERPSALSQAAAQGNVEAVRLLLRHDANIEIRAPRDPGPLMSAVEAGQTETARVLIAAGANVAARRADNHSAVQMAVYSGEHDLIDLLEDAANVPVHKRNVPQAPFAPGAHKALPRLIPGTVGAVPTRHLLWVSARELLILRESPRRFSILNTDTGRETLLPALSRRRAAQERFDPDTLTLSPEGDWLLGYGGARGQRTWLATQVRGVAWQEWPRDAPPADRTIASQYPVAWMDSRRWVELGFADRFAVRIRTRGSTKVEEVPVVVPGAMSIFPLLLVSFSSPQEGPLQGSVGHNIDPLSPTGEPTGEGHFVTWQVRIRPALTGWRLETREITWKQAEYAGFFYRCVLSPRGDRLAWLNAFPDSGATAILMSSAQGARARIAYEHLYPVRDHEAGRAGAPWPHVLEWTPDGKALAFWRGPNGRNGLCLLLVVASA